MGLTLHIPKLGFSMTEGTLLEWLVPDGAQVTRGQEIYTLETDKVENVVEAPVDGTIRIIGVPGETYPVGELIAEIAG